MPDPQISVIVRELERVTERVVVTLTLDANANFTEDTPIDTGWAAANWIPSIGAGSAGAPTPTTREGREAAVAGQRAAQQAAITALATGYSIRAGATFITNGVPYIVDLNEGSSQKAPAGFVQAGIQRAADNLRRLNLSRP